MPAVSITYVVSFTSQDNRHPVTNLVSGDGYKKWLCQAGEKTNEIEAVFQLQQPCVISYIDIGTIWCANVEIQVGRSEWPASRTYETLVHTLNLMTPVDCTLGRNTTKTQMFSSDLFCPEIAKQEWDRLRIICRQPYKKLIQFGLSFIRIKSSEVTSSSESREDNRQQMSASVKAIQKHFFGKNKTGQSTAQADLQSKLLKIAGSGEAGMDHVEALPRTAKLVLAASGNNSNSTAPLAEKIGLYSDCLDQKYRPSIEEEIKTFLDKLEILETELDTITLADVRHKFERKKRRKLTREEKKVFIQMAKEFIASKFGNRNSENDTMKIIINSNTSTRAREVENKTSKSLPVKRKLDDENDVKSPKSLLGVKMTGFRQQIKSVEMQAIDSDKNVINSVKRSKLDLPVVRNSVDTPSSTVYQYRGLRHGENEDEEEEGISTLNHKTPGKEDKFGDFNIQLPWSPNSNTSNSECVVSPKDRGQGRGRGRSRGRRGQTKKNGVDRVMAAEMRPTSFTRCDGCNNYYAAENLPAHQLVCRSRKHNEDCSTTSSDKPESIIASSTVWLNSSRPLSASNTPNRSVVAHTGRAKQDTAERSEVKVNLERSPPWLLAAERRLKQQMNTQNGSMEASPGQNPSEIGIRQSMEDWTYHNEIDQDTVHHISNDNATDSEGSDTDDYEVTISDDDGNSFIDDTDNDIGLDEIQVECPLCGSFFPDCTIEMHAATCNL